MRTEQEMRLHRCCFTGHRPEKLFQSATEVQKWLRTQILKAIDEGFLTFITGMAMGVDIWAGEIVLEFRQADPRIHLIAAVPWPGFAERWNSEWKNHYDTLLKKADLVRYISKTYDSSVFTKRNYWMVDHSSKVIAYYNGSEGGAKETIEYAQSHAVAVVVGGIMPSEHDGIQSAPMGPDEARTYPLNLLDAILLAAPNDCKHLVQREDIPGDFDRRLRISAATIDPNRAYTILMYRYQRGMTLQEIGENYSLSRERVRQLLNKYLRRLRHPDILRYLNCGISNIPSRTSQTMTGKLKQLESNTTGL